MVVPEAAANRLKLAQQRELVRYLHSGGAIVADGRQGWLEDVGFEARLVTGDVVEDSGLDDHEPAVDPALADLWLLGEMN